MKAYQVVLVDDNFTEFVAPKVFLDMTKAEDYKHFVAREDDGWWKMYIKEVELVE